MPSFRRTLWACLTIIALLWWAPAVLADLNNPLVVDPEVLGAAPFPGPTDGQGLAVQATAWQRGDELRYVITITNFSSATVDSLYLLDRYFDDDPERGEIVHDWYVDPLDPGQSAAMTFDYPDGALDGGCHQLELGLAEGLGVILMDCSAPNMTTVWDIPLTNQMVDLLGHVIEPLMPGDAEGPTKVGLHVTRNASPAIMDYVETAYPPVVVAVGDLGWLAEAKDVSPDTITLARFNDGAQDMVGDPAEAARDFVAAHRDEYLNHPAVDYWLGWNEPNISMVEDAEWYAAFEAERANAMADLGLKVAIGNFSTGTPEADEFAAFLPAIEAAKAHDGILALHEYSAPAMWDGFGAEVPGMDGQSEFGALTLRYRFWYRYYLQPNDLVIPLVITETGIDGGVLSEAGGRLGGWRDFAATPDEDLEYLYSPISADDYLDQISWYDDELRRDDYVWGCAVFNAGDDDGDWASFDVTDLLPELAARLADKG